MQWNLWDYGAVLTVYLSFAIALPFYQLGMGRNLPTFALLLHLVVSS